MKKKFFGILLLLFVVVGLTACGTKNDKKKDIHKDGTAEDFMDVMVAGYNERDVEKIKSVMPDFMQSEFKITNDQFKEGIESAYGTDLKVSYKITDKKKVTDEWLEQNNKYLKEMYKTDKQMTECYEIKGTITFKSSKKEDTDEIEETWHCKIDDKWYLIFG